MGGLSMHHPDLVSDLVDLEGFSQGSLAVATAAAQTAALTEGVYDVWCDQNCYIKVATTANDVTSSTGYYLRQNNTIPMIIRDSRKIGAIMDTATGTLKYHQIG